MPMVNEIAEHKSNFSYKKKTNQQTNRSFNIIISTVALLFCSFYYCGFRCILNFECNFICNLKPMQENINWVNETEVEIKSI